MTFDKDALAQDKDRYKNQGGDGAGFFKVEEGEVTLFLCPPARNAKLPYYPAAVHYTGDAGIVCANDERNPILKDKIFKRAMKDSDKAVPDNCPLCEDGKPNVKFMMIVVPLQKKGPRDSDWSNFDEFECRPYLAPRQVWNGIADMLMDIGPDVCDPTNAVLIKIKREGKTKTSTKYTVMPHVGTLKKQKALPKKIQKMIAEMLEEDAPADPYKILVNMFKNSDELEAAAEGMEVSDEKGNADLFGDEEEEKNEKAEKKTKKNTKKKDKKSDKKDDKKKDDKKRKRRPECFGFDFDEDETACETCKLAGECEAETKKSDKKDEPEDEKDEKPPTEEEEESGSSEDDDDDLDALLDD